MEAPANSPAVNRNDSEILDFAALYIRESEQLQDKVSKEQIRVFEDAPADDKKARGEPWVMFTPKDRFGLALSGGGIRSATFNLGLMQALAHLGILRHVEYLSTVSGGGYVGGFWTAWLKRKGEKNAGETRFPLADETSGERAEVRHLREFSRFLLPRIGITETELWGIVATVLGGLLPSLITAIAALCLAWCTWVAITGMLLWANPAGAFALGTALGIYLLTTEGLWWIRRKSELNVSAAFGYVITSIIAAWIVVKGSWFWPEMINQLPGNVREILRRLPHEFYPAALLGAGALFLIFLRVLLARVRHWPPMVVALEGCERTLARILGATAFLLFLAALWWIAGISANLKLPVVVSGTGATGFAALFAWAKKWLSAPVSETHGSTLFRTILKQLKRATPKILASLALLCLYILVGASARYFFGLTPNPFPNRPFYELAIGSGLILFLAAFFFDPARVGMHEFYRTRISRCYLGASNLPDGKDGEIARATNNRQIIERKNDDLFLPELAEIAKPVHLICTAANDISGDPLGTLYRGAKSAVLSGRGISIGNQTASLNHVRVSSALTASAAAFNSQMGRISMDLGPAVTFLMSALNLRLGLWVPHPRNRFRGYYVFPGRFFLFELFGRSRANAWNVHLSDGNHFENFGLYELIRRHVRYIIVSDCGADPEVAFDDLANVLRRVREDFGVEVEIDVRPLRPDANRISSQHAVVGTIHYNGITGMDKGTIVYFKPSLSGDEPPDVLQYRTRNRAFPHETTGDQFYDEPQWESYRRLGEHAARSVFGFFDRPVSKTTANQVDGLFKDARSYWHPSPPRQEESFLEMTERCASLEADLLNSGPAALRGEVFSEVAELRGEKMKDPNVEDEMAIFSFLLRATQIMEDVWLSADLDHYWSHPLNQGWMNYFHRWASTPSFRRWWPIIGPIYSLGFREFAKERFRVGVQDPDARAGGERVIMAGQLRLHPLTGKEKSNFLASHTGKCFQQANPKFIEPANAVFFGYELQLLSYDGTVDQKRSLPVGLAVVNESSSSHGQKASWQANHLFVPESLHGGGILARLLDALIRHYSKPGAHLPFRQLEVQYSQRQSDDPKATMQKPKVLTTAMRQERVQDIEFYKSRGFQYMEPEQSDGSIKLVRNL